MKKLVLASIISLSISGAAIAESASTGDMERIFSNQLAPASVVNLSPKEMRATEGEFLPIAIPLWLAKDLTGLSIATLAYRKYHRLWPFN